MLLTSLAVVPRSRQSGEMGGAAGEYDACDEGLSFDDLFTRYHGPIYTYLLAMVGDVEQAQNVAQDTFLTAYKALPRTPDPALPSWLYRIATAAALGALRRRCRPAWLPFAFAAKDRRTLPDPSPLGQCAGAETVRRSRPSLPAPARLPAATCP